MDIQRTPQAKPLWKKYWVVFALVALLCGTYFLRDLMGNASYFVSKDALVTAVVEQGDFIVNVRASGVLKPLNTRWISTSVAGRVEQVLVKPGAQVSEGDVLAQLSNPELHRNLDQARWDLKAQKAESHVAYVTLEAALVDLENAVLSAQYSYQSAKLKLDAETALIGKGNGTVSALEYQRSQLNVKQQKQFWYAQKQNVVKLKDKMRATKIAQQARIGSLENTVKRVTQQVEGLRIKATTNGVVQQVSLALGERAQVGDSVALIANQDSLFAELHVQEVRAQEIALGQPVIIDTRTDKIQGNVTRIAPSVQEGSVSVDVAFTSIVPQRVRPEMTVDGLITITNISNTNYVKRPVFAPKNSRVELYKLSQDKQFARKHGVHLGQSSVSQIQILNGLQPGDEIIISDTTSWQQHSDIRIN